MLRASDRVIRTLFALTGFSVWRSSPMRFRLAAGSAVVLALAACMYAGQARAAAEVHRLSFVLSASPTQVAGGDVNDAIDQFNQTVLSPIGNDPLEHIQFTWAYDGELRYFVRPSFAVSAGLSHLRAAQRKEFLPAIGTSWNLKAEVITVPIHVGAAYYLQPYNQGDFQARMFFGGGLMQYTYSRATFGQTVIAPGLPSGTNFKYGLTQDSPGYYLEAGGHMFFASHWSVLISGLYRSGKLRNTQYDELSLDGQGVPLPRDGSLPAINPRTLAPFTLDVGGAGVRFAAAYGF
jgi:hypothetical protein